MIKGENNHKLIWFQHLHKCAGSTVVELARLNGETFPERHRNGNPCDKSGRHLPIWEYGEDELNSFVDGLISRGVTFTASEQGSPNFQSLVERKEIILVTGLRSPRKRYFSAYRHHYCRGGGQVPRAPEKFWRSQSARLWSYENYFTRVFSEIGITERELTQADVELALSNLAKFENIYNVENSDWLKEFASALNWQVQGLAENRNVDQNIRSASRSLLRGDFGQFVRRILVKKKLSQRVLDRFAEKNAMDEILYSTLFG
ncbi:hypothetical protein [Roseibacillus persicicus]|uniref:hypothetical protein n=1 Tax=Roseibacillus persicicus TaxID=454148 RepID=UPI0016728067|nr:hypothetical protein [Roseibacillus persicicus]